jgi:poly(ADP-ribose) glycohydrolase
MPNVFELHSKLTHRLNRQDEPVRNVSTGNWGCGVFGGDLQHKSIIQWIAASLAGVQNMHYYTFRDQNSTRLPSMIAAVKSRNLNAKQLYKLLGDFELAVQKKRNLAFDKWLLQTLK